MTDSTLWLYTSLTAGSSHIVTATARLETILKANKVPFKAIDVATDDIARKLWGRRSKGRKLPGLVKFNQVIADLEEVEEWNEYGELRMQINSVEDFDGIPDVTTTTTSQSVPAPSTTATATTPAPLKPSGSPRIQIQNPPVKEVKPDDMITLALKQASLEAASKAKANKESASLVKTSTEPKADTAVSAEQTASVKDTKGEQSEEKPALAASAAPRTSVVPVIDFEESEGSLRRPLISETAAVSSADIHADDAEALGLVEHHRGSIVSATSKEEIDQARELRKSISGGANEIREALKSQLAEQEPREEEEEDTAAAVGEKDDAVNT